MSFHNDGFEMSVREQLAEIKQILARLDDAIRGGDGDPGILIRLDRLETHRARHAKLLWSVVVAFGTALATYVLPYLSNFWIR